METTYNGWKNRETWNVNLWLANDEQLYRMVMTYGKEVNYRDFATNYLVYVSAGTPDGVPWLSDLLDYEALDELLEEMG
jgi:hypothetical protein